MKLSRVESVTHWELMISSPHGRVHVVGTYTTLLGHLARETLCGKRPELDVQLDTYEGPFERPTACMKCRDAVRRFSLPVP